MSADAPRDDGPDRPEADPEEVAALYGRIQELEREVASLRSEVEEGSRKMVIVASKGTLDMAYPPLVLSTTAAAFGYDVSVFHTFWGVDVIHEEQAGDLKLSAVGNPNMPMPNALASVPGMDRLASTMMRRRIDDNDIAGVEELIDIALDSGVDLQACQMTMDLMDYDDSEFFDGVTTGVGAASAFEEMVDADIQLLV